MKATGQPEPLFQPGAGVDGTSRSAIRSAHSAVRSANSAIRRVVVVIGAVVLAGCGIVGGDADESTRDAVTGGAEASPVLAAAIDDVEEFWAEEGPKIDLDFEPVDDNRILLRSELSDSGPAACSFDDDTDDLTAESVEDNAYVLECDEGNTVVFDDVGYVVELQDRFGEAGPVVLVAHEWGHVVQNQLGQYDQSAIVAEQQADCYSGAFIAWAEGGGLAPFDEPKSLDDAILSTIDAADEAGTPASDEDAHGNGFDRVRATQEGYDRGVEFCAGYDDNPPPVTQIGFSAEDENEGNLPFEEANRVLLEEVSAFFEDQVDESIDETAVLPEQDFLQDLYDAIGDNAIGAQYALAYGEAAQTLAGDPTVGDGASLQRACLMGSWLHAALEQGDGALAGPISPGDVDEAMLIYLVSPELDDKPGLIFELLGSMRLGTVEGIGACALGR